ncbi:LCP family protein [Salinibacterium sp. ZJ450]|uniref:LCP family protein n=1 Tax=Salinibacterium sp. ZJ450 TaxID=2708338 RepID=UPI0014219357|nr:LCP family protein [Salinibacterium sp. ZJ450]
MTKMRSGENGRPAGAPTRHGRLPEAKAWPTALKGLALVLSVLLISTVAVIGITAVRFSSGIDIVDIGKGDAPPPSVGAYPGGFNILIVGSDTREGQGAAYGKTAGTLNDVNMLLHVSADHSRAIAVSIPRDTIVPVPSCEDDKGRVKSAMSGQPINSVLSHGGLGCVVATVERLTDLDIQFAGMITFQGVIELSNAVGGVPVCVDGPMVDAYSTINLPEAGEYVLSGAEALAFLRTRHGVGDGSDLARNASQRVYLSSLVRTLQSGDTLGDPVKVYQIAEVALNNMTFSASLGNITTLISLAQALKDIPLDQVQFVQYPTQYSADFLKVRPNKPVAGQLFEAIAADLPFQLAAGETGAGATIDPKAPVTEPTAPPATEEPTTTETPDATAPTAAEPEVIEGLEGQTAADHTCSVTR